MEARNKRCASPRKNGELDEKEKKNSGRADTEERNSEGDNEETKNEDTGGGR